MAGRRQRAGRRRRSPVEETSAGGLVIDARGGTPYAVLIARRGRTGELVWSLPKGHVESGETPEQAALREIAEETGIEGRVVRPLGAVDYSFLTGRRGPGTIHKTVHHFLVEAVGGELSADDVEVEQVELVPLPELVERLAFANERALVAGVAGVASESPGEVVGPGGPP